MWAICFSKKYPYSPHKGFFGLNSHPSGNSSLSSYIPLKILAFNTPSTSEFPMTLFAGGMDIFWNHTMECVILWLNDIMFYP